MTPDTVDVAYVAAQYSDAERLRIRYETHQRFSENTGSFLDWMLPHLALFPAARLLDVGCGPGSYHSRIAAERVAVTAVDASAGMVREARAQAGRAGHALDVAQASAEALPLRDASFDIVMCNHVLYHVPDRERALREMRRMGQPGGRVVLATNAADNNARLHEIHVAACREFGYEPLPIASARFTLDDLALVRSVFPGARVEVRGDAFVFPDTPSAVRYYNSYGVNEIAGRPADNSHRAALVAAVPSRINEIIAGEGVFRVPKRAGCFVADVDAAP